MILFGRPDARVTQSVLFVTRGLAVVSGLFTLIVCILMIANAVQLAAADPLDDPVLLALRERYRSEQGSETLQEQIRALDLLARRAYFTRRWQLRSGTFLLLGGAAVLVGSLRVATLLSRGTPRAEGSGPPPARVKWRRRLVAGLGAAILVTALLAGLFAERLVFSDTVGDAVAVTNAQNIAPAGGGLTATPFPEAYGENWPGFRGPGGTGIAPDRQPPTQWGPEHNLLWKTEVPLPGQNSPVVWGDRVFLTGGDAERREVYCWSADDGVLLWRTPVGPFPGSPRQAPEVTIDTGHAASTTATDGESVFAIFATGDIVALDWNGNPVWGRNLGVPGNHYGHSSSLLTFGEAIIVLYDHQESTALYALSKETGEELWKTERETEVSWSSPAIIETDTGHRLLVNANPYFAVYDPVTGRETARFEGIYGEVASSPAFGAGRIIAVNQTISVMAIDPESGELLWESYGELPDTSSPLATDQYVFVATSYGVLFCLDITTGDRLWTEEFEAGFYSSPVLAGDHIYLFDRNGLARVFEPRDSYREVGRSALGEPVVSTPAFVGSKIFVRGETHLFCIGGSTQGDAAPGGQSSTGTADG